MFPKADLFCPGAANPAAVPNLSPLSATREIIPDQGNLDIDDSRINDGCPRILLIYPQVTLAPSLYEL